MWITKRHYLHGRLNHGNNRAIGLDRPLWGSSAMRKLELSGPVQTRRRVMESGRVACAPILRNKGRHGPLLSRFALTGTRHARGEAHPCLACLLLPRCPGPLLGSPKPLAGSLSLRYPGIPFRDGLDSMVSLQSIALFYVAYGTWYIFTGYSQRQLLADSFPSKEFGVSCAETSSSWADLPAGICPWISDPGTGVAVPRHS